MLTLLLLISCGGEARKAPNSSNETRKASMPANPNNIGLKRTKYVESKTEELKDHLNSFDDVKAEDNAFWSKLTQLIDDGAKPSIQANDGITALHSAVFKGHEKIVKLLLEGLTVEEKKALVQIADDYGITALHIASSKGHDKIVELLLEGLTAEDKKELVQIADDFGDTALNRAVWNGHEKIVELLLQDLSVADRKELIQIKNDGDTALHLAVQSGHDKIVELLLQDLSVADRKELIRIENKDGKTAQDLAAMQGQVRIQRFLNAVLLTNS